MSQERLTSVNDWESRWNPGNSVMTGLAFNPKIPMFQGIHKILSKYLPRGGKRTMLEVGAYPGKYLWYFYKYFAFEPWGVEYVESCAKEAQVALEQASVPGKILTKDFFELDPIRDAGIEGWDMTVSFGFVEHFENPSIAVRKHISVTRPGGLVFISIPNHAGWNGKIMKMISKKKWAQHNKMSLQDLRATFDTVGGIDIIWSGHIGHIGFWNTCLYETIKPKLGKFYYLARLPTWAIEHAGRFLVPNNRVTSPDAAVLARRR